MPALRPIERDYWSEDVAAATIMAMNQGQKLSLGFQQYRQRFPSASAGVALRGSGLGGGVYDPPVAPNSPAGNIGSL